MSSPFPHCISLVNFAPLVVSFISKATLRLFAPLCASLWLNTLPTFAQDELDYASDIAPILEQYCVKCHGPDKQKSGYRLDTYERLLKAGDSDEDPIEAHYPMDSPLLEYLLLPPSDDYAMPPEDEDRPSADDILTISHWIYQGAPSAVDKLARLPIEEMLDGNAFAAVERLREKGAIIHKRGENESLLFLDLQDLSKSLSSDEIADLNSIASFVAELIARHLPASMGSLSWISDFESLERLDLSHSRLGDNIVSSLNKLAQLNRLVLFGTQVTDEGAQALAVPESGSLYLGQTKVRPRSLPSLRTAAPQRTIHGVPNLNETLDIVEAARGNSNAFNPMPEIEPARQVSASGIRHSVLVSGRLTALFDEDGKVAWLGPRGARDGMVLENGNILLSVKNEAREYAKDSHKIVWSYALDKRNKELGTVYRLPSGNTLVVERGPLPRLLEVDSRGKIVVSVPLQPETDNNHMQTRMARKLPNGNYLVPHLLAFKVKEYDPSGSVVNTIRTDLDSIGGREAENWPFTAIRLPNGNTVVNLTHGNKTVEFAPDSSIAWVSDNSHVDGRFSDPCGGQRLPNGNTVVASYGQKNPTKVKLFEVTPNNEVVWEFFHPEVKAHQVHVLTTNGQAISPIFR